jgi:hypothetical protein
VETGLLKPEIMTDADIEVVADDADGCRFRMTRVGFPVFLYPSAGQGPGVVRLNGKLIRLPAAGSREYSADGVGVTIRALEEPDGEGPFPAELVLRLPGAAHELGFHGFAEC